MHQQSSSHVSSAPSRTCPECGTQESIQAGSPIWPTDHVCPDCNYQQQLDDGIPVFAPELANTISGFDPRSFAMLAEIEENHFWFAPRSRMLVGLIKKFFPTASSFLEIGCGTGVVLSALSGEQSLHKLVGSELHPAGLAFARQRLGSKAEFVQMDARKIMADGVFDVIGAFDVIEHIVDDGAVLASAYKALRPGGGVVISVPQHPWLWSSADEIAYHERRYTRGELEAKLAANGFTVVYSTSYCSFLLPFMIVSRLLERWRKSERDSVETPDIEASPPTPINILFRWILQIEVSTILKGISYPLGGSRIVIAVRE